MKGIHLDWALQIAGFRRRERLPVARREEKSRVGAVSSLRPPGDTVGSLGSLGIRWGAWGARGYGG